MSGVIGKLISDPAENATDFTDNYVYKIMRPFEGMDDDDIDTVFAEKPHLLDLAKKVAAFVNFMMECILRDTSSCLETALCQVMPVDGEADDGETTIEDALCKLKNISANMKVFSHVLSKFKTILDHVQDEYQPIVSIDDMPL